MSSKEYLVAEIKATQFWVNLENKIFMLLKLCSKYLNNQISLRGCCAFKKNNKATKMVHFENNWKKQNFEGEVPGAHP